MEQTKQRRTSTRRVPVWRLAAGALAAAGLSMSVMAAGTASAANNQAATSISTAKNAKLGTILVSSNGKTVYTLKGSKTACTAQCLKVWPAVNLPKGVAAVKAGSGVSSSKLGTVKRAGGVRQVTYAGKPLYYFVGDKSAGAANGNVTDTWGTWSTVVTAKPASSSSGTTTAGSGGASF